MNSFQLEDTARLRRQRTREAISLAMEARWEEAIVANQRIIDIFPDDVDAYNRLGRAHTELGQYSLAREAYNHALEHDRNNTIARKNLTRLAYLKEEESAPQEGPRKVAPQLFIEETGKSGTTNLDELAPQEVLAKLSAGDLVNLQVKGNSLIVEDEKGQYLGQVEPKLALRLLKLIEGGNEYKAAVASAGLDNLKIIIKEVYQHPSQAGRPSFPTRALEGFRPYTKESLVKYELEEEETATEAGEETGWEEEGGPTRDVSLFSAEAVHELEGESGEDEEQ
ncbi:MAG: tetratricopeptide repeat protein [Chloroflexi bacterium]|nr:tetratricopeptide repeat protein [Chloroflexota bacterium]